MCINFGGIPSTILFGWFSDKLGGRRSMASVVTLIPILAAFAVMAFTPARLLWVDMLMLVLIGLFIYPVVNLISIIALDVVGKKAIGTAAGFIGLFGYLGRTIQAKGFGWRLDYFSALWGKETAWMLVIATTMACTLVAIILMTFLWKLRPRA